MIETGISQARCPVKKGFGLARASGKMSLHALQELKVGVKRKSRPPKAISAAASPAPKVVAKNQSRTPVATRTKAALSPKGGVSKKSIANTVIYLYKRKDPLGYLHLHTATEELVVEGCLYAASDPSISITPGPKKIALIPLQTSPNFVRDRERDRTFAVIMETGERLRVVGRVVRSEIHRPQEVKLAGHTAVPASTVAVAPFSESTNKQKPQVESRPSKSQSKESDYQILLERVRKAATLDGDTRVRMSFVSKYVGLSDKTIYRKIQKGTFPASTKQDGGAFWWVSTLDAYLQGNWSPPKHQL